MYTETECIGKKWLNTDIRFDINIFYTKILYLVNYIVFIEFSETRSTTDTDKTEKKEDKNRRGKRKFIRNSLSLKIRLSETAYKKKKQRKLPLKTSSNLEFSFCHEEKLIFHNMKNTSVSVSLLHSIYSLLQ